MRHPAHRICVGDRSVVKSSQNTIDDEEANKLGFDSWVSSRFRSNVSQTLVLEPALRNNIHRNKVDFSNVTGALLFKSQFDPRQRGIRGIQFLHTEARLCM